MSARACTCSRPGGADGQSPHTEDEVYVVLAGRAQFTAADGPARPGRRLRAAAPHRFHDIAGELA